MHTSTALTIVLLVLGTLIVPARAQTASGKDTTIRTTIIMRSKASDCPPGFTVFLMSSAKKMPLDPKICFVRTPKPKKG